MCALQPRLTPREARLVAHLRTPRQVQRFLNLLPYNDEPSPGGATLRSFRGVVKHWSAHCMEAALAAAVILEYCKYPPLVLSLESVDHLDHVLFVYRRGHHWGSVARSRDPGLHGRRPVFRTARDLALSYVDPYIDLTGRIVGYAVVDLRLLGRYDWRFSARNISRLNVFSRTIRTDLSARLTGIARRRRQFLAFAKRYPNRAPLYYRGRERWSDIPEGPWGPGKSWVVGRSGPESRSR